ncbi:MAG: carboxymuconolactone decarboxylase family protein, partial [Acidimicrobiales bacterium]
MHTKDALAASETEERLFLLGAWRVAPFYTEAERAALELTEAVTLIAGAGVPDDLYQRVRRHFDERAYMALV